ncbi:MAG: hypothetical protein KIT82_07000 [Bradyrhizobium sp.]|nr:hypothetical protein [Bradyrhizobium sp.]
MKYTHSLCILFAMTTDETVHEILCIIDLLERRMTAVEDKLAGHMTEAELATIRQDQSIQRQAAELSRGMRSLRDAVDGLQADDGPATDAGAEVSRELANIVQRRQGS